MTMNTSAAYRPQSGALTELSARGGEDTQRLLLRGFHPTDATQICVPHSVAFCQGAIPSDLVAASGRFAGSVVTAPFSLLCFPRSAAPALVSPSPPVLPGATSPVSFPASDTVANAAPPCGDAALRCDVVVAMADDEGCCPSLGDSASSSPSTVERLACSRGPPRRDNV